MPLECQWPRAPVSHNASEWLAANIGMLVPPNGSHEMLMSEMDIRTQALWNALPTVIDPELGLDIVTLGLVYGVEVRDHVAWITHTLTTPGCPMERVIRDGSEGAALLVEGISGVETRLVWDPAWHAGMIAADAW